MKISQSGNERFYRDRLKLEEKAEAAHKRLFRKHRAAYEQFFDLVSEHGEAHVRENHPDLAKAVDLAYGSIDKLNEVRSDNQARYDALKASLVAEMGAMAAAAECGPEPIAKLRADLKALREFRVKYLDGVDVNFWLFNALSTVGLNAKNWLSGPAINEWCRVQNIQVDTMVAALKIVSPLWELHISRPEDNAASIVSGLDAYPFDIDQLLENALQWRDANRGVVEALIVSRSDQPAAPAI